MANIKLVRKTESLLFTSSQCLLWSWAVNSCAFCQYMSHTKPATTELQLKKQTWFPATTQQLPSEASLASQTLFSLAGETKVMHCTVVLARYGTIVANLFHYSRGQNISERAPVHLPALLCRRRWLAKNANQCWLTVGHYQRLRCYLHLLAAFSVHGFDWVQRGSG